MGDRTFDEDEIVRIVSDPTSADVGPLIDACADDERLAGEVRSLLKVVAGLRSLNKRKPGPVLLDDLLARYATQPSAMDQGDYQLARLYLAVSKEPQRDLASFEEFRANLPFRRTREAAAAAGPTATWGTWLYSFLRPAPLLAAAAVAAVAVLVVLPKVPTDTALHERDVSATGTAWYFHDEELYAPKSHRAVVLGNELEMPGMPGGACAKVGPAGAFLRLGVCIQPVPINQLQPTAYPLTVSLWSGQVELECEVCDDLSSCFLYGPPERGSYRIKLSNAAGELIDTYDFSVE